MRGWAPRTRTTELVLSLGGIVGGALLIVAIPELRHGVSLALHGDLHGLRTELRDMGTAGLGLLVALMLAHAILWYPTEIVTATAGLVYGFFGGLALVTAGWLASGLLTYLLGRAIGRPLIERLLGRRRLEALERGAAHGGVGLLLVARLIPVVPFSLTGYIAGAAGVRPWTFAWTTLVGYVPLTAAVTYLGSRAASLSLSDPWVWVSVAAILVLFAVGRLLGLGRGTFAAAKSAHPSE